MYYPCSENKGADQLRGYREADLRLCFRIGKNPVFSRCGSCMTAIKCFSFSIERASPHSGGKTLFRAGQGSLSGGARRPLSHGLCRFFPIVTIFYFR